MAETIFVYVDLSGEVNLAGRLWIHNKGGKESASFEYDKSWLMLPHRFSLDPALLIGKGSFHTTPRKALFGAIGDSAPDRWGRTLMQRAARFNAKENNEPIRYLREIDYLLKVNDTARQGALRFSQSEGGEFLANNESYGIPPRIQLPKLLNAADAIYTDGGAEKDLKMLLAPGSSLGGARPKASIQDHNSRLLLAKFPKKDDTFDEVAWEATTLSLAKRAGIQTPQTHLIKVSGRNVLLLDRFDRKGSKRIPFLSGMSMLVASDHENRSYLELADALIQFGARPKMDMQELWRRIVFTVLVTNVDDHMRNHGFLYQGTNGWILSPAYDINPVPADIAPRILSSSIDLDDNSATIENALNVYEMFGLSYSDAKNIIKEVSLVTSDWRNEALKFGLKGNAIDRFETAFEHEELKVAKKIL